MTNDKGKNCQHNFACSLTAQLVFIKVRKPFLLNADFSLCRYWSKVS